MAKKKQAPQAQPKVSKLPLPITDSPLVIDLPDGQKIVVGKMTNGSVIEVATWRGVGRPDSRTSRLMLGVGAGNVSDDDSQPSASQSAAPQKKPEGFEIVLFYLNKVLVSFSKINFGKLFAGLKFRKKQKKVPSNNASEARPTPLSNVEVSSTSSANSSISRTDSDSDVEEWLNQISLKANASVARANKRAETASKSVKNVRKAAPKSTRAASKKR